MYKQCRKDSKYKGELIKEKGESALYAPQTHTTPLIPPTAVTPWDYSRWIWFAHFMIVVLLLLVKRFYLAIGQIENRLHNKLQCLLFF